MDGATVTSPVRLEFWTEDFEIAAGDGKASRASAVSVAPPAPLRSWNTKPSPMEANTKGMSSVVA